MSYYADSFDKIGPSFDPTIIMGTNFSRCYMNLTGILDGDNQVQFSRKLTAAETDAFLVCQQPLTISGPCHHEHPPGDLVAFQKAWDARRQLVTMPVTTTQQVYEMLIRDSTC